MAAHDDAFSKGWRSGRRSSGWWASPSTRADSSRAGASPERWRKEEVVAAEVVAAEIKEEKKPA